jgi:putative membrane protein
MAEPARNDPDPSARRFARFDDPSVELSARRTGMSFQRTRLSADRTLMSVMRTSLSLISFGFTIYQFFRHLEDAKMVSTSRAPRTFGEALIYLGIGMVLVGIVFHIQFMIGLRRQRAAMAEDGLIHGESHFPASFTLIVAILLLFVGIAAVASIALHEGPFS